MTHDINKKADKDDTNWRLQELRKIINENFDVTSTKHCCAQDKEDSEKQHDKHEVTFLKVNKQLDDQLQKIMDIRSALTFKLNTDDFNE